MEEWKTDRKIYCIVNFSTHEIKKMNKKKVSETSVRHLSQIWNTKQQLKYRCLNNFRIKQRKKKLSDQRRGAI